MVWYLQPPATAVQALKPSWVYYTRIHRFASGATYWLLAFISRLRVPSAPRRAQLDQPRLKLALDRERR